MPIKIIGVDSVVDGLISDAKALKYATKFAINESLRSANTAAIRAVTAKYNIKRRDVAGHIKMKKATNSSLRAFWLIKSGSVPLIEFATRAYLAKSQKARRRTKGVRYKIKKKQGTKVLRHSFINISISRRAPYVLLRKEKTRYPLRPQTVFTPSTMFQDVGGVEFFETRFFERFEERFNHHLRRLTL